jgi:hypothetical protein
LDHVQGLKKAERMAYKSDKVKVVSKDLSLVDLKDMCVEINAAEMTAALWGRVKVGLMVDY